MLTDIFGAIVDGVHELGLSDAEDADDFFAKLMSIEQNWNRIEICHRHFLASQKQEPVFYDWFCQNYSTVFFQKVLYSQYEFVPDLLDYPLYNSTIIVVNR